MHDFSIWNKTQQNTNESVGKHIENTQIKNKFNNRLNIQRNNELNIENNVQSNLKPLGQVENVEHLDHFDNLNQVEQFNHLELLNQIENKDLINTLLSFLQDLNIEDPNFDALKDWIDDLISNYLLNHDIQKDSISIEILLNILAYIYDEIERKISSKIEKFNSMKENYRFQILYFLSLISYYTCYLLYLQNHYFMAIETIIVHFQNSLSSLENETCWKNLKSSFKYFNLNESSTNSSISYTTNNTSSFTTNYSTTIFNNEFFIEDADERLFFQLISILFESLIHVSNLDCANAVCDLFDEKFSSILQLPIDNSFPQDLSNFTTFQSIHEIQLFSISSRARIYLLKGDKKSSIQLIENTNINESLNNSKLCQYIHHSPIFLQFRIVGSLIYALNGNIDKGIQIMEEIRNYIPESYYIHQIANFYNNSPHTKFQLLLRANSLNKGINFLPERKLIYDIGLSLLHLSKFKEAEIMFQLCKQNDFNKPLLLIRLAESVLEEYHSQIRILHEEQSSTRYISKFHTSKIILPITFISPLKFETISILLLSAEYYLQEAFDSIVDINYRIDILVKLCYVKFELEKFDEVVEYTNIIFDFENLNENQRFFATIMQIASLTMLKENESLYLFIQQRNVIDYYHVNRFLDPSSSLDDITLSLPTETLILILLVSEIANGNVREAEFRLLNFIQATILNRNSSLDKNHEYIIQRWIQILNIFILVTQNKLNDAIRLARTSKDFPPIMDNLL